jgi:hypothetical protein
MILLAGVLPVTAQDNDKRIDEIRRLDRQANLRIAESESVNEGTGLFCNELVVNKGDKPWPAVGIYQTIFKFYYTYGDREKNPYPDRLMKVTVATRRSDQKEYAEYLFNPAGQLIFHYEKKDEEGTPVERRYYFSSERLIRRMTGARTENIKSREVVEAARVVLSEKLKLVSIFRRSLDE